jgi:hypothetical protein
VTRGAVADGRAPPVDVHPNDRRFSFDNNRISNEKEFEEGLEEYKSPLRTRSPLVLNKRSL